MGTYEHAQVSFAGGEISDRLWGRFESDLYKRALARAENAVPIAEGGFLRALGSTCVRGLDADSRVRMESIRLRSGTDLAAVLLDGALRLYTVDGQDVSPASLSKVQAITNGEFNEGMAGWAAPAGGLLGTARFPGNYLDIVVAGRGYTGTPGGWYQKISVAADSTGRLSFSARCQLNGAYNNAKSYRIIVKLSSKKPIPGGVLEPPDGEENWTPNVTGSSPAWNGGGDVFIYFLPWKPIENGTPWYFTIPDTIRLPAGDYWVSAEVSTAIDTTIGGELPFTYDVFFEHISLELTPSGPAANVIPAPWTADQARDVQVVKEPGRDRAFFFHGACAPFFLELDPTTGAWSYGAAAFSNPPRYPSSHPSAGSLIWGVGNYPATGCIFQGRLYVAGVPSEPNSVFASRSGMPLDFSAFTDALGNPSAGPASETITQTADCSIYEPLASKGAIRWMAGRRALLIGTDLGEESVVAQSGVVSPMDFQANPESFFGSAPLAAIDAGDQALYLSADRRKLRGIKYSLEEGWVSKDITFTGEHLTRVGVKEIHFARDPVPTLILLLWDGTLACCTYDRAEQVAAWYRRGTRGSYLSMTTVQTDEGTVLLAAVQRATGIWLERTPCSELATGACYLDAANTQQVPADLTLRLLDHLVGQEVDVIVDGSYRGRTVVEEDRTLVREAAPTGAVVPDAPLWVTPREGLIYFIPAGSRYTYEGHTWEATVRAMLGAPSAEDPRWADLGVTGSPLLSLPVWSNGKLVLDAPGVSATVGLPYRMRAITLPPEGANPRGTSQRATRRWVKAILRLNDSALPLVNGQRPADRTPSSPMDTGEPLFTGDVQYDVDANPEDRGQLTIEQDLPLRTEVLALFGSVSISET